METDNSILRGRKRNKEAKDEKTEQENLSNVLTKDANRKLLAIK